MRPQLWITITVACASIGIAQAQQASGTVQLGGWPSASIKQSKNLVSEYEPTSGGGLLELDISLQPENGSVEVRSRSMQGNAQQHEVRFDVNRRIRSVTTLDRLPHNLGHDPLTDLQAATPAGRQLWFSDASPAAQFGTRYGVLDHRTEFQVGPNAIVAATFRDQHRAGYRQVYAVSHCEGCHVQSQARPVDERTRNGGLQAILNWLGGTVQAGFDQRRQREGVPFVLNQFDRAVHPELRTPIFDNRLQFGRGEGPLPIDLRPDMNKDTAHIDMALPNVGGFALTGGAIWSQTENLYTHLKAKYRGYALTAARALPQRWRLSWRGRAYSIRNDDVFVSVVQPASVAGPQSGKTYQEIYGFDPNWTRYSALNRDVIESRVDVSRRIGKRAGAVRLFWSYNGTDRQHYQVAPGKSMTGTNIVGVGWTTRLARKLRVDTRYAHGDVQNPFMLVNGACSTFTSGNSASPLDPHAGQYFSSQNARIADTTASPRRWDELRAAGSYVLGNSVLALSGRWWNGTNRAGDLTNWSRRNWNTSLTYTVTPSAGWNWFAGYSMSDSTLRSPICVPLYDG